MALGGIASVVLLLPGAPSDTQTFHGHADVAAASTDHVPREERLAITQSLQRFVRAGLGREDLATAWALSGAGLRGASSRTTWLHGDVPFIRYRARPFGPDAWRVVDATPSHVVLDLFVQPTTTEKQGPATFTFDVQRARSTWKVSSVYASVLFAPQSDRPKVLAANDFRAPGAADPRNAEARLSSWWLLAPVVAAAGLLALLGLAVRHARRGRPAT